MAFRTFKRHLTSADRRAKETITACVAGQVGIDYLPDAPRFRYTPRDEPKALEYGPPSSRGSVACGRNPLKLRSWSPMRLDASPMYSTAMAGDPPRLTAARRAWAEGDPGPLREYLADLGKEQGATVQPTLMEAA